MTHSAKPVRALLVLPNLTRHRVHPSRPRVCVCVSRLISYGKTYWSSRVTGSLEDFIYRRPGEPPRVRPVDGQGCHADGNGAAASTSEGAHR